MTRYRDAGTAMLIGMVAAPLGPAAQAQSPVPAHLPASLQTGTDRFTPPGAAMVLTRTLRRPMRGGAQVVTRRHYLVHFVPDAGGGFRLDGRLLSAEVDAPPALAMLAELERTRPDNGLFPMRVDSAGRLLAQHEPAEDATVEELGIALSQIREASLPPRRKNEAEAFLHQIGESPGSSLWPTDLLRPQPGRHAQQRDIVLPDGTDGTITVETVAAVQNRNGLLASFSRTVTTRVGDDSRESFEEWTLVPGVPGVLDERYRP